MENDLDSNDVIRKNHASPFQWGTSQVTVYVDGALWRYMVQQPWAKASANLFPTLIALTSKEWDEPALEQSGRRVLQAEETANPVIQRFEGQRG